MRTVCAQQDGSISSLVQCVESRAYVLAHIVGPFAVTLSFAPHLLLLYTQWIALSVLTIVCSKKSLKILCAYIVLWFNFVTL